MSIFDQLGLPANVLAKRQFSPIEDIVLGILRDPTIGIPEIPCHANLEVLSDMPLILVRGMSDMGDWGGDPRGFYDTGRVAIHVYAKDPDGDMAASVISEAVRRVMFDAWRTHWRHPDLGVVTRLKMTGKPTRLPDWATATGPVQFADLPTGTWRYESRYSIVVGRPRD